MLPGDSCKSLLFVNVFRQLCDIMYLGRSLCGHLTAGPPPAIGPSTPIAHPWACCQCDQMPIPPISITVTAIITGKVPSNSRSLLTWPGNCPFPPDLFVCLEELERADSNVLHELSWAGGELGLLSHPVAHFLTVGTSVVPCHCDLQN